MITISTQHKRQHRGVILLLAVFLIVVLLAMIAFAVDLGYLMMAKTQLQNAADSAALAAAGSMGQSLNIATNAAKTFAGQNLVGQQPVQLAAADVTYGTWDKNTNTFTPVSSGPANAAKVTARADSTTTGAIPLFFGRILNIYSVNLRATATATCNPRDICFVVDLSGSMNDDTDPDNTGGINNSYPGVGTTMMQDIFNDFGFGSFSNAKSEAIGAPLGVSSLSGLTSTTTSPLLNTKQPLTLKVGSTSYKYTVLSQYQIKSTDSYSTRKQKAYSWVMDVQLRGVTGFAPLPGIMPAAKPTPNSTDSNNYNYWQYYLSTYSSSIGYSSYMHMMMANGRNVKPTTSSTLYTPLSINSADCPYHPDTTLEGDTFNFPPREMPTHSSRLAIIDALHIIKDRNQNISDTSQCDWISIVTFDITSDVVVLHDLDNDYNTAMQDCTKLQACSDSAPSTSTETGFMTAINLLNSKGRQGTNKVVVLLTDGKPNLYSSSAGAISNYEGANANTNYYGSSSYYPQDAAMMQAAIMQGNNWSVFPVQLGLQGDADFMNRIYSVAMGKTTQTLTSPYDATGDPTLYEQDLIDIFNKIISNPKLRLVNPLH
ncbi:MAG: pilus assembly protein TadG-related protein [Thermoguttaceae bacterium]